MKVGDLVRVCPFLGDNTLRSWDRGIVIALEKQFLYALVHARVFWGEHKTFWHESQRLEVINESR